MPAPIAHYHHDQIAENGFTVIRGFLSPDEVVAYRQASEAVISLARDGHWPHVRTRGKQFPPWPKNFSPDIWGISGLLHPDLGDLASPFHQVYSSDKILAVAGDILQTSPDGLSMELMNMLINPLTDFGLDWHRDTIKPEVEEAEEARQLADIGASAAGAQFNLALTHDRCLIVIPKSHNRVRTAEERTKTIDGDRKHPISGQITVDLHPGDIVFYNNNILHRGQYDSSTKRITLHGSYGHTAHGRARAMGILQHGVAEWLPRLEPQTDNLAMLKAKLVALARDFDGVDVGYALDG